MHTLRQTLPSCFHASWMRSYAEAEGAAPAQLGSASVRSWHIQHCSRGQWGGRSVRSSRHLGGEHLSHHFTLNCRCKNLDIHSPSEISCANVLTL